MKTRFIFAIAVMALAISCAKNFDELENAPQVKMKEITLNVSSDIQSKVSLQNDLSVTWDAGDSISVLVAGQNCKFVASASGASVDFTGSIPEEAEIGNALVIYPYSSSISVANDTLATVNFPHRQKVSKICNMMAGKVASKGEGSLSVGMKNVGGLVEFSITRTDITSVSILSNNSRMDWMAGEATLYLDKDGLPVIASDGQKYQYSSVVALPDGETFAPGTYYVAVPAKSYTKGIIVRMQNTEKKYASKTGTSAFTVARSHIKPLPAIDTDVTFAVEVHTSFVDYNATNYSKCGICVWPFVEDEITDDTRAQWLKKDTTLTTKAEGYQYHLYAHTYVQNTNSSCQGFKIGKVNDKDTFVDYLQFPVIAGYGLTKAVVQIGNYNPTNVVTLYVVKNGIDTLYTKENLKTAGTILTFDFDDPQDGDTYRIYHNDTRAMSFRAIDCYYKIVSAGAQTVSNVTVAASDTLTTDGTTATINATFECQNYTAECTCGIEYKAYDADSWTSQSPAGTSKSFSVALTGLAPNTLYNVRSWAKGKDDVAKVYSSEKTFVTRGPDFSLTLLFGTTTDTAPAEYEFWTGSAGWGLSSKKTAASDKYYSVNGAAYQFTLASIKGYVYRKPSTNIYHGLNLSSGAAGYGYIQLPAINGFRLKSVVLNGSAFKAQTIVLSETIDNTTLAPTKQVGSYTEPNKTVYPTNASVTISETLKNNTRYYLVGNSKDITLAKLVLTYTKAD